MLTERLRQALAPEYEILREVAGGGMGVVFAARQVRLDRTVAIKILRPELATAIAAERFLDEGKILARLAHPTIVPIYDAGEADGLFYYVMEFVEGETLAERLERGPLGAAEAQVLAHDLFGALGAAHAQGVVHRDVKPANIFLRNGRALLGDFGIARWRTGTDPGLTTPGQLIGTPRYMAPEQRDGQAATERTDVYDAGLVLWEACAGERWPAYQAPEQADWRRVPAQLADPLRRALALDPEARFADAGELLAALPADAAPRHRRWLAGGLLAAAALIAVVRWFLITPTAPAAGLTLEVEPFEVRGVSGGAFRDSLTAALITALSGYPDLRVLRAGSDQGTPGAVRLSGLMTTPSGGLRLELHATGGESGQVVAAAGAPGRDDWPALVRQVVDSFLAEVWRGRLSSDQWLPLKALPRNADGLSQWYAAERLYAEARWDDARNAYVRAEAADSSCILCTYRVIDIDRWLANPPDSQRFARLSRHLDAFPPPYRAIIDAQQRPWPARYDSLRAAANRYQGFFLASFLLGDELFHRGPLYSHLRHEALEPLQHALDLRPDFGPGREHLAWVLLSEGSAAETRRALDRVPPDSAGAGLSIVLRIMLQLGYDWRFGPSSEAAAATGAFLQTPVVERDYRTPAGGRLMMTVDAPAGAVGLGSQLATWRDKPEAVRSGLLAQAHGFAALGRMDSLRAVGLRLRQSGSDHALALYALELEGLLTLAEPDDSVAADPALLDALQTYTSAGVEAEPLKQRAAWMLALLSLRGSDSAAAAKYRGMLGPRSSQITLGDEVEIARLLHRGDTAHAGRLLSRLPQADLAGMTPVPLEDAVRRLLHAAWLERAGAHRVAEQELRWPEHLQLGDFPTGDPQPGEGAWAISTLLRWRRARMLDQSGAADQELCATYRAVARLWSGAEPRLAARAAAAGRRAVELKCESTT